MASVTVHVSPVPKQFCPSVGTLDHLSMIDVNLGTALHHHKHYHHAGWWANSFTYRLHRCRPSVCDKVSLSEAVICRLNLPTCFHWDILQVSVGGKRTNFELYWLHNRAITCRLPLPPLLINDHCPFLLVVCLHCGHSSPEAAVTAQSLATQHFFCPHFTTPLAWLLHSHYVCLWTLRLWDNEKWSV